ARKRLVKKVFTPAFVTVADEPHELPRGVQGKGPRPTVQFQPGLLGGAVALAVITPVATSDEIFPGRAAPPRARYDMVQGQLRTGEYSAAKLACIAVAQQNVIP